MRCPGRRGIRVMLATGSQLSFTRGCQVAKVSDRLTAESAYWPRQRSSDLARLTTAGRAARPGAMTVTPRARAGPAVSADRRSADPGPSSRSAQTATAASSLHLYMEKFRFSGKADQLPGSRSPAESLRLAGWGGRLRVRVNREIESVYRYTCTLNL
jgi:hypothetical protein